jgi:vitamin B12 transporter
MQQRSFVEAAHDPLVRGLACSICALPLWAACAAALAQPAAGDSASSIPAQQVTLTGTRLPMTPSGMAQTITVVADKEIQVTNPANVEEALSRVPGLFVDRAGAGGFSSLYMRGAESSHVLIMIDGVRVNDPTTTRGSAYDLSSIDIYQLDRIEVLRGPASAIYGADALAGVVNFITKRGKQSGVGASAYGAIGQYEYQKAGGSVSAGNDLVQGLVSAGYSHEGSDADNAYLRLNTYSGSLRFTPGETINGEVFGYRTERRGAAFPDDSGGSRLAVNRELTLRDAVDTVYGASLAGGDPNVVRVAGNVSVYERTESADNAFVDPGVRFPVPAFLGDTDYRSTTLTLTATRNWGSFNNLVVGVQRQTEKGGMTSVGDFDFDGNADNLQYRLRRRTDSAFAEGRWRVATPLSLQIGVRYDDIQDYGSSTTPHLGAVWDLPNGTTTLKANYSQGFKPPSFFALGFPIGGNPNLKPEESTNYELTLVQALGNLGSSLEVSVFRTEYQNLVDFDSNTFTNINRGSVTISGIEPTLKWRFDPAWRLQAGVTALQIDEKDGRPPLRNRPESKATVGVVWDIDARSSLFAVASYTGSFIDRSNPTGDIDMPSYSSFDMAYSIQFGWARMKLAVDNLFGTNYEQFVGFPALQRRFRFELRADF